MGCPKRQPFLLYNEETMYFVGINIGIDKTTVSRSPGYNGEQVSQIILNPHSHGGLGSKIIDTAICKNNGDWSLVYDSTTFISNNVRYGFTGPISKLSPDEKESMIVFIKLLFHNILINDPDLIYTSPDNKNFELGIACPLDWVRQDSNAQQEYLNFFRYECGVPVDFCMRETDAKLLDIIRKHHFDIKDNILVIDSGPYTIDFSLCSNFKRVYYLEQGYNIGTRCIVDALIPHILKYENNSENLRKLKEFRNSMGYEGDILTQLSLYVQAQVERYFIEWQDEFLLLLPYRELTPNWPGPRWDICVEFEASKNEFDKIISGYTSAVKDAIVNSKARLDQYKIIPNIVYITGDRTGFKYIKKYAEEIFDKRVYIDPDIDYSVSNGIALYMYHDSQFLDNFLAELRNGLIGITILNIDYKKIDMAIGHALRRSLAYDIDSSSIDSKRNVNISSPLFLSNKDVNSILEERIMKYAIKVFREHMYFDVKY